MEPTRSGILSVAQQHALALRQADLLAYAEQKALDRATQLQRQVDTADQAAIGNRRQLKQVQLDRDQDARPVWERSTPTPARVQGQERFNLQSYEIGQASTPFLAQQVAQGQLPDLSEHEIFGNDQRQEYQTASEAYLGTKSLTATILGLQGFRERIA